MALHYVFIAWLSHYSPGLILRGRYDGSLVWGRIYHEIFHIQDGTANLSFVAFCSIYGMAAFYKMKIHNLMQEQNKVQPFTEQPSHSAPSSEDLLVILMNEKRQTVRQGRRRQNSKAQSYFYPSTPPHTDTSQ